VSSPVKELFFLLMLLRIGISVLDELLCLRKLEVGLVLLGLEIVAVKESFLLVWDFHRGGFLVLGFRFVQLALSSVLDGLHFLQVIFL